jgi:hypothetical protein
MPQSEEIAEGGSGRHLAEECDPGRKTVLIYSPDLNFSFSLSLALQDRYHVVTTSNAGMLTSFARSYAANIAIIDCVPSEAICDQIDNLKSIRSGLHIIMTYVYDARDVTLDGSIRGHVEAILYKPFEVETILSKIQQLVNA